MTVVAITNDHTEWFDFDTAPTLQTDPSVWGSGDGISSVFFIEGTGSLNLQNKGTGRGGAGHSKGATTVSGHIHLWINSLDIPNTEALGGWAIRISSNTTWNSNYGSWNCGGRDTSRIRINGFIPFVADSGAAFDRSASPPALTAVQVIWAESDVTTNSGQKTVYLDRVFFGTHSRVQGGATAGAAAQSSEIAANSAATPVFISVNGVYYVLDGWEIGDDTAAASQFFQDNNETWVFAGFPRISNTFYRVEFRGHATGTHSIIFGTKTGTGIAATGAGGNTFVAGGSQPFNFVITDPNVDTAGVYGCIFNNAGNENGTFNATLNGAEIIGNQFNGMGQITLNTGATGVQFTRNGVTDSVTAATGFEEAAVNLGTTKPATDKFRFVTISGASRYSLRLEGSESTGNPSWDLTDIVSANPGTKDILLDYPAQTGGSKVTINLLGTSSLEGDFATAVANAVDVTGGLSVADVVINQSVPVTLTFVDQDTGSPIQGANIILGTTPGATDIIDNVLTDAAGQVSVSYSGSTPQAVQGFARKGTDVPTYKALPISGTIGTSGLVATLAMVNDD